MPNRKLRISYLDFWSHFEPEDNFLTNTLRKRFDVEVVDVNESPDLLIYSCFGRQRHYQHPEKLRIYYTGENDCPNFNECDYGISMHHIYFDDRHLRPPLYCFFDEDGVIQFDKVRDEATHNSMIKSMGDLYDREFCSAVISNGTSEAASFRIDFFNALSSYRQVASGGRWNNNVGGPVPDKIEFIKGYRFNLAIENSSIPGYTTEKILNAFFAGTVPVYWGNPAVAKEFNPTTFINLHDFDTIDNAVDYIASVDTDRDAYMQFFKENPLKGSALLRWEDKLNDFVENALTQGKRVVMNGRLTRMYNRLRLGNAFASNPLIAKLNILKNGRSAETRL